MLVQDYLKNTGLKSKSLESYAKLTEKIYGRQKVLGHLLQRALHGK